MRSLALLCAAAAVVSATASPADPPHAATRAAFATYFGGAGDDVAAAVTVAADGSVFVAGTTTGSPDLPTSTWIGTEGFVDGAFVAKFSADGALVWCTRVGGVTNAHGLAVDSKGRAWLVGETGSGQFPAVNPSQRNAGGQGDAYVLRLAADGKTSEFATYLGGAEWDVAWAVAVDSKDRAVVVGQTLSSDFPRIRATQSAFGGTADAFVARFGESGPDFSTFLGGSGIDWGLAVAIGPGDDVYVGGVARSDDFPTTPGAPMPSPGVAFLARLNLDAPRVVAATLLASGTWDLRVRGLVALPDGSCSFVATADGNLPPPAVGVSRPPLVNPPETTLEGPVSFRWRHDKFNSYFVALDAREYGALDTWRGGNSLYGRWSADGKKWDAMWGVEGDALAIARRADGEIAIAGHGARCATSGAWRYGSPDGSEFYDSTASGDAFVACLSPDGRRFTYATEIGGAGDTSAVCVAFDGSGNVWTAGSSNAADLATRAPQQAAYAGGPHDLFVARLAPAGPAPTQFAVARAEDKIALSWQDASAGAASFEIERMASTDAGDHAAFHATPTVVATLAPGTTTWNEPYIAGVDVAYRVVAVLPSGSSAGTPLRSPGFIHPASPSAITATVGGGGKVHVRWSAADKSATKFLVLDDDGNVVAKASKSARAATFSVKGSARVFHVVAVGRAGTSLPSESVEVAR